MTSISHWGMFDVPVPVLIIPKGWHITRHDWNELMRPDGMIEIVRD